MAARLVPKVILTYCNEMEPDGAGAQLQRIAAIFGISEMFSFGYLHSGIRDLSWNPGDGMDTRDQRKMEIARLNELFRLPDSHPDRGEIAHRETIANLGIWALVKLALINRIRTSPVVVEIQNPHKIADKRVTCYKFAGKIWSNRLEEEAIQTFTEGQTTVAVHVRRAVTPPVGLGGRKNPRYVEPSWYREALNSALEALGQVPFRIEFHSDALSTAPIPIPAEALHLTREDWEKQGIKQTETFLTPARDNFSDLFDGYSESELVSGITPSVAITRMAQADILIGAKSSMSFVAGLLRGNRPTIFPKFWHPTPKAWLSIRSRFSRRKIIQYLRQSHV